MSVINLIFVIGKQISIFKCDKNMSKDIIRYLLYKDLYKDKKHVLNEQNHKIKPSKGKNNNIIPSEKMKIKNELIDKINKTNFMEKNDKNIFNAFKEEIFKKREKKNNSNFNNKILEEINIFHILKSYFFLR